MPEQTGEKPRPFWRNPLVQIVALIAVAVPALVGIDALISKDDTEPFTSTDSVTNSEGVSDSPRVAVAAWWTENETAFDAVTDALLGMGTIDGNSAVYTVERLCRDLQSAVDNAQLLDPIPLPEVQEHWSSALDHFERSAALCIEGTETGTGNASLIRQGTAELELGSAEITQASETLNRYT